MAVRRLDVVEVPDWIASKFEFTPEGHLKGRAAVTNIGVFSYRYGDGKVVKELRLPEEVFDKESMTSLSGKAVTVGHPDEFITDENKDILSVGASGNEVLNGDNIYLSVDLLVNKPEGIQAIKDGAQYLSCGYNCDVEFTTGKWLGVDYDAIQRNIRYNHIALVENPRAGETARIKMDHMDADDAILVNKVEEDHMAEKVDELAQKLDDVTKQNEALTKTNTELTAKVDGLAADKTALEAERDTLKDKVDSLENKNKELEAKIVDETEINKRVATRVALIDQAKDLGVEVKIDMAEMDVKKAVIMKIFPKAVLEGKNDAYIDARYDAAIEFNSENKDAEVRKLNQDTNTTENVNIVDEAKQKYLNRLMKREAK